MVDEKAILEYIDKKVRNSVGCMRMNDIKQMIGVTLWRVIKLTVSLILPKGDAIRSGRL